MRGNARQRWRARIETQAAGCGSRPARGTPASDGGRGLKRFGPRSRRRRWRGNARQRWRARIETLIDERADGAAARNARQRWRARIETSTPRVVTSRVQGTPASDGGRGLKPDCRRQPAAQQPQGTPASDGGRGLKPRLPRRRRPTARGTPASDGGRGLKRVEHAAGHGLAGERPPAMAGAD